MSERPRSKQMLSFIRHSDGRELGKIHPSSGHVSKRIDVIRGNPPTFAAAARSTGLLDTRAMHGSTHSGEIIDGIISSGRRVTLFQRARKRESRPTGIGKTPLESNGHVDVPSQQRGEEVPLLVAATSVASSDLLQASNGQQLASEEKKINPDGDFADIGSTFKIIAEYGATNVLNYDLLLGGVVSEEALQEYARQEQQRQSTIIKENPTISEEVNFEKTQAQNNTIISENRHTLKDRVAQIGHRLKHNPLAVALIAIAPALQGAGESPTFIAAMNKFFPNGVNSRDIKDLGIFSLLLGGVFLNNTAVSILANHFPLSEEPEKSRKEIVAERLSHLKKIPNHMKNAGSDLLHSIVNPIKGRFTHVKQTFDHLGRTTHDLYNGAIKAVASDAYHMALMPIEGAGNSIVWLGNTMEKSPITLVSKSGKHVADLGRTLMWGPPFVVLQDRRDKKMNKASGWRIIKLSGMLATIMQPVNAGVNDGIHDVLYPGLDLQTRLIEKAEQTIIYNPLSKYKGNGIVDKFLDDFKYFNIPKFFAQAQNVGIHKLFYSIGDLMNFTEPTGQAFWGLVATTMVSRALYNNRKNRQAEENKEPLPELT